jgi:hypothetical protein
VGGSASHGDFFKSGSGKFIKHPGVSMRSIAAERITDRNGKASFGPQLTALMIAVGLLAVWVGLCAI